MCVDFVMCVCVWCVCGFYNVYVFGLYNVSVCVGFVMCVCVCGVCLEFIICVFVCVGFV